LLVISCLILLAALILDQYLGEPKRFHPLVMFGHWVQSCQKALYADTKSRGVVALILAVLPIMGLCLLISLLQTMPVLYWVIHIVVLYLCMGLRSLELHGLAVHTPLVSGDIDGARAQVAMIVSRDTQQMDETQISTATVESMLENGHDSSFNIFFWYLVLGLPGAVLMRLVNTLDAMWGYKTPEYINFGWAAARLDDAMGYIPARLTALAYALTGRTRLALQCWKIQAAACDSPNGGPVMTSGAGALNIRLGGSTLYHGVVKQKPPMGCGETIQPQDISRAITLVKTSLINTWFVITLMITLLTLAVDWGSRYV
jgi:adenosylcobinamide-phosphate synthase